MIELSNGHRFEYMASSGALAYDGRGWLWEQPLRWLGAFNPRLFTAVTKTLTYARWRGNLRWSNPFGCIRFIPNGVVNAVELTNPGIDWWCKHVGPSVSRLRQPLVVSIAADDITDLTYILNLLNQFDLVAVELNLSCPNAPGDHRTDPWRVISLCECARRQSRHPIILKLSVEQDYLTIARKVESERSVEAIAINSVPWNLVFPDHVSPLIHLGGGAVSGRAAQHHTWEMLRKLVAETSIPVIGASVWSYDDALSLRVLGARAIGFGSIFLRYPWKPTLFVRRDMREQQRSLPYCKNVVKASA